MRFHTFAVRDAFVSISVGLCCSLLLIAPMRATAQTGFGAVRIIVTDQNGTPISNVSLCLAMPGQSMGRMTDQNGVYNTSLPTGSTTIRFSRSGYANAQEVVVVTNGANLVRQVRLQPGQSTPLPSDCGVPATATDGSSACDVITAFRTDGPATTTNRQVTLVLSFSSAPNAYRIKEFSEAERYPESQFDPDAAFNKSNPAWVPNPSSSTSLTTFFSLTEPHYGTHSIYVQTRRYQSGCVSRSRGVSVVLAPASYQTHTLKGAALQQFINEAKARGYDFRSSFEFIKKDTAICAPGQIVEPLNPTTDERAGGSAAVLQTIRASFDVFVGPDLMPFWDLASLRGSHPNLESLGNRPDRPWALEFDPNLTGTTCLGCGPRTFRRQLNWRRSMYDMGPDSRNYRCLAGIGEPYLTELTLRGPAGQDPISALGDSRASRPVDLRVAPPQIRPRGGR